MRAIKFRAWDKDRGKMFPVFAARFNGEYVDAGVAIDGFGNTAIFNYELMQYTGLHDKNGKEIYEGDILHFCMEWNSPNGYRSFNAVVEYQLGGFWFRGIDFNFTDCNWHLYNADGEVDFYEVIGNIYENPELLCNVNKEGK